MIQINSAKVTLSFKTTLIYFKVPIIFFEGTVQCCRQKNIGFFDFARQKRCYSLQISRPSQKQARFIDDNLCLFMEMLHGLAQILT